MLIPSIVLFFFLANTGLATAIRFDKCHDDKAGREVMAKGCFALYDINSKNRECFEIVRQSRKIATNSTDYPTQHPELNGCYKEDSLVYCQCTGAFCTHDDKFNKQLLLKFAMELPVQCIDGYTKSVEKLFPNDSDPKPVVPATVDNEKTGEYELCDIDYEDVPVKNCLRIYTAMSANGCYWLTGFKERTGNNDTLPIVPSRKGCKLVDSETVICQCIGVRCNLGTEYAKNLLKQLVSQVPDYCRGKLERPIDQFQPSGRRNPPSTTPKSPYTVTRFWITTPTPKTTVIPRTTVWKTTSTSTTTTTTTRPPRPPPTTNKSTTTTTTTRPPPPRTTKSTTTTTTTKPPPPRTTKTTTTNTTTRPPPPRTTKSTTTTTTTRPPPPRTTKTTTTTTTTRPPPPRTTKTTTTTTTTRPPRPPPKTTKSTTSTTTTPQAPTTTTTVSPRTTRTTATPIETITPVLPTSPSPAPNDYVYCWNSFSQTYELGKSCRILYELNDNCSSLTESHAEPINETVTYGCVYYEEISTISCICQETKCTQKQEIIMDYLRYLQDTTEYQQKQCVENANTEIESQFVCSECDQLFEKTLLKLVSVTHCNGDSYCEQEISMKEALSGKPTQPYFIRHDACDSDVFEKIKEEVIGNYIAIVEEYIEQDRRIDEIYGNVSRVLQGLLNGTGAVCDEKDQDCMIGNLRTAITCIECDDVFKDTVIEISRKTACITETCDKEYFTAVNEALDARNGVCGEGSYNELNSTLVDYIDRNQINQKGDFEKLDKFKEFWLESSLYCANFANEELEILVDSSVLDLLFELSTEFKNAPCLQKRPKVIAKAAKQLQ